ncbi:hypothetical protein BN14_02600 [Rhizoctonia solani AG-1 IB]|uniref:Uncharacterized protein n=1 Tax=Thanatephorus cucumeris (strain AG1-IB / isolate 7/3/14) TaxID=1108050 RepID=M5BM84_THACB|nr:hypothetical protein BN14_02600 [Rhizoctonia solani AG-1 IB]
MLRPHVIKPINTACEELTETDFLSRPPSAPSNIETISLWGPCYPGQRLHPSTPYFMSPVEEDFSDTTLEVQENASVELDHPEILNRIVALRRMLEDLIEQLPESEPVEELDPKDRNPNGPITSYQLFMAGMAFIESLEPLRPLVSNKLTDAALKKNPELEKHVHKLEHSFDNIERVLRYIPQVYEQVTEEECGKLMIKVEAVMSCLGVGSGAS